MHNTRPAKITSPITSLNEGYVRTIPIALIIGAVGIGASLVLSQLNPSRFLYNYLVSFCFVLSISLGCLFFVTIMHLTRAGWSATVRRVAELYAMCAFPLFLLFLPILFTVITGNDTVYPWVEEGYTIHASDAEKAEILASAPIPPLEQLKGAFLDKWFFTGRIVAYFLIWGGMAFFYLKNSLAQDVSGDKKLTARNQAFSAPFMILFAASIVFASFDLEMSLSPLWFSTMFPVYFFAGAFLSALCTIMLTCLWLQRTGRVTDEITIEHYHDLGKLMQGFVIFWGYIAFSQFLLIWYANIPEETFWYDLRINQPGWKGLSLFLLVGHLFIPFFLLMGRGLRRNKIMLTISAVLILCMHWVDHYWLVMPHLNPGRESLLGTSTNDFTLSGIGFLTGVSCLIGMIAIYIALFCIVTRNRPLVALQDPRLGEALNHEVH